MRKGRVSLVGLLSMSACVGPQAALPPAAAPSAKPAIHGLRVAVLPLRDAREPGEAPDERGDYVYRGRVFRGTNLDWLRPSAMDHFTRRFAESLLRTGLFHELVLVRDPRAAPKADLLLRGAVLRARGYVEADPEDDAPPWVLSEVVVSDLELVDADSGAVRFRGATGWSIWEQRPEPVDPWVVLAEAMDRSVDELAVVLAKAELERFVVLDRVALELGAGEADERPSAPPGWTAATTSTASRPRGWDGEARCGLESFEQAQTLEFHRVLGPYVPTVQLWTCPPDVRLRWSARAELPAVLLGRDPAGAWLFGSALGRSNWPDALEQVAARRAVTPPESPYVVEISGEEPPRAVEGAQIPSPRRGAVPPHRRGSTPTPVQPQ